MLSRRAGPVFAWKETCRGEPGIGVETWRKEPGIGVVCPLGAITAFHAPPEMLGGNIPAVLGFADDNIGTADDNIGGALLQHGTGL